MANNIEVFSSFVQMLDEVYQSASLTGVLDGAAELARQGVNVGELIVPIMRLQGLADYSRNGGYVAGDATLTNETIKCNFDRGRMFTVDYADNAETAGIAFGRLAGEFIRTKVVPELDAFRIAMYAGKAGVSAATPAALTSGAAVVEALRAATSKMDEDEVTLENRCLFITPTLKGMVDDLDTTKSRRVMERFARVLEVPQTRMYTAIEQRDGVSEGKEAGGYAKAADGKNLNFLIVQKDAVIQYQKHVKPKVIDPDQNQSADAWKFGYRNIGIADVYASKLAGVYVHAATT